MKMTIQKIARRSISYVGYAGVLVVLFSHFLPKNEIILMAGQIMSILSYAMLVSVLYWTIKRKCRYKQLIFGLLAGATGITVGLIAQISADQILDKPPIFHLANMALSLSLSSLILKIVLK